MAYKIYELHCGSYCPHYANKIFPTNELSCRCLLIETEDQLILCDTGLPQLDWLEEKKALSTFFLQPSVTKKTSAFHQIKELGFDPKDVRHILITHLDVDHCGGLADFPWATVHIHDSELQAAESSSTKKQTRYFKKLWESVPAINTYNSFGNSWHGFECVQQLKNLPPEILLIPLVGHSKGHSGFAINTNNGWVLHAGDAFFFKEDLSAKIQDHSIASELLQTHLAADKLTRYYNIKRLMQLQQKSSDVRIINSHDPRLRLF